MKRRAKTFGGAFTLAVLAFTLAAQAEEVDELLAEEQEQPATSAENQPAPAKLTRTLGVFITEDPYVVLSAASRIEITRTVERLAVSSGKYQVRRFPEEVQQIPVKKKCENPCRADLAKEQKADFFVSLAVSQLGSEVYLNAELVDSSDGKLVRSASLKIIGADEGAYRAAEGVSGKIFLIRPAPRRGQASGSEFQDSDGESVEYPKYETPSSVNTVKLGFAKWESVTFLALQNELSWGGRDGYFYLILPNLNLTSDGQQFGLGLGYKYRWYLNLEQFHPEFELFGGLDADYLTYKFEYHEFYPAARYGGGAYYQFRNDLGLGFELAGVSGYLIRAGYSSHKVEFLVGLHY